MENQSTHSQRGDCLKDRRYILPCGPNLEKFLTKALTDSLHAPHAATFRPCLEAFDRLTRMFFNVTGVIKELDFSVKVALI